MTIIIDNPYAILRVYPHKKIIHHEIHKYIYGEPFQELMMKGADAFEENHCTKWLSDDRGNSAPRPEDIAWTQSVWEPRVIKAGWKHLALVLPEKVIGQMSMKKIINRYHQQGIKMEIFSDPEMAIAWLERQ